MSEPDRMPHAGARRTSRSRWLLGLGALLTLLGSLTIEVSLLLFCAGLPVHWVVRGVLVGTMTAGAGAALLVVGNRGK